MALRIHPIKTGSVRIKNAQISRQPFGPLWVLTDSGWSDSLPIYSWLIEHPEGLFLVDTGETCRSCTTGYFPPWHPYYRVAVDFDVRPEEEIGPSLLRMGIKPGDIRAVVMTHLHTDHAGGLHHFPDTEIWVSEREWAEARGIVGKMRGYLPHRWPREFSPRLIPFPSSPYGPFLSGFPLTKARDVMVVPTPGHTPGHVSVIVRIGILSFFLAGDVSYTEQNLLRRIPDGVTFFPRTAVRPLDRILVYARTEKTIYLPAHDPKAEDRLKNKQILGISPGAVTDASLEAEREGR